MDNILRQYSGRGLIQYLESDVGAKPEDPYSWSWLGIALDRGPDSWAAKQFLKYEKKANVEEFPDQSHDCWNDEKNTIRETGLWNHALVMVLALNLAHAPFEDGKWFEVLRDAFLEYHRLADHHDPLFLQMLPKILLDWDAFSRRFEPNIAQWVWDRLPDQWCWERRGAKVGMCRFFGFILCSTPYRRIYHTKLLGMIYLGLQQGWLHRTELKKAVGKTIKIKDTGAEKKQTMAQSKKEVGKLFGYGNGMQLVTICKLETDAYFHQCMIEVCSKPLVDWHADQNRTLRSCGDAGPWFIKHARGGFLVPVAETFGILWGSSGEHLLARMSFTGQAPEGLSIADVAPGYAFGAKPDSKVPLGLLVPSDDHPAIAIENQRATTALSFGLNLGSNRIRRCYWAMRGWPAQSTLLGDKRKEVREATIATLRADLEAYGKCRPEAPEVFDGAVMSVFNLRPVKQVVAIMEVASKTKAARNVNT